MKMTIFLIFGVLLMLSNLEAKSFCITNGCSIPGHLPYFYKNYFAPACDKHDVCYACVRVLCFILVNKLILSIC